MSVVPVLEPIRVAGATTGSLRPSPSELRSVLAERYPGAVALPDRVVPRIPTGFAELDEILPNGGLPRGRLTVWQSRTGGATALLRSASLRIVGRGERVAWIDGGRTGGPHWSDGPLVVRPASEEVALRAAEILLRSGGFALVVLAGVDPAATAMLRLSRMAHEGGAGFVAITRRSLTASLRISSRYLPAEYQTSPGPFGEPAMIERVALSVEAKASGWSASAVFHFPLAQLDWRSALEPGLRDRRGAD